MKTITRIGVGPRMSDAVIFEDRVYLSGVCADTAVGKSVYEQTVDALAQIDAILKQAGTSKDRILKANIWLNDITTFDEMNRAWDAWITPGNTPARATVQSQIADVGYDVEIMIEAAR